MKRYSFHLIFFFVFCLMWIGWCKLSVICSCFLVSAVLVRLGKQGGPKARVGSRKTPNLSHGGGVLVMKGFIVRTFCFAGR